MTMLQHTANVKVRKAAHLHRCKAIAVRPWKGRNGI